MKVLCNIIKYEQVEVEIPDRFRGLAVPVEMQNEDFFRKADFTGCIEAVEETTGIPFGDNGDNVEHFIFNVMSLENDEMMLEC